MQPRPVRRGDVPGTPKLVASAVELCAPMLREKRPASPGFGARLALHCRGERIERLVREYERSIGVVLSGSSLLPGARLSLRVALRALPTD